MKYKQGDICIVFSETPTYEEGGVVQVIDRDPNDGSYAVAHLQEVGKCDMDLIRILQYHAKWVKEDNLQLITYQKPAVKQPNRIVSWIRSLKIRLSGLCVSLRTAISLDKKP